MELTKDVFSSYGGIVLQVKSIPDIEVDDNEFNKKTEFHITIINRISMENIFSMLSETYNTTDMDSLMSIVEDAFAFALHHTNIGIPRVLVDENKVETFVSYYGVRHIVLPLLNQEDWVEYCKQVFTQVSKDLEIDIFNCLIEEDKNPIFHITVASQKGKSATPNNVPQYLQLNLNEGYEADFGEVAFGDKRSGASFYGKDSTIEKDTQDESEYYRALKLFFSSGNRGVSNLINSIDIEKAKEKYPDVFGMNKEQVEKYIEGGALLFRGISYNPIDLFDMIDGIQDEVDNVPFLGGVVISDEVIFHNILSISSWTPNLFVARAFSQDNTLGDKIPCILVADANDKGFFMNPDFTDYVKRKEKIKTNYKETEILYSGDTIECKIIIELTVLADLYASDSKKFNNVKRKMENLGITKFF